MTLWMPSAHIARSGGSHLATRPATAMGAALTPGTGGYGSWVNLIGTTATETQRVHVVMSGNGGSGTCNNVIVKLGIDYAGGTSYTDLTPGLICGSAGAVFASGRAGVGYMFPLCIPAGAAIAAAAYGSSTVPIDCLVTLTTGAMQPMQAGRVIEAIGLASNYVGTAVTAGTTSEGAWTSLGTTSRDLWAWELGMQVNSSDTNWGGSHWSFDLAWGDASNKHIILEEVFASFNSAESMYKQAHPSLAVVPAGATIYARAQQSAAVNDPVVVTAYGVGG